MYSFDILCDYDLYNWLTLTCTVLTGLLMGSAGEVLCASAHINPPLFPFIPGLLTLCLNENWKMFLRFSHRASHHHCGSIEGNIDWLITNTLFQTGTLEITLKAYDIYTICVSSNQQIWACWTIICKHHMDTVQPHRLHGYKITRNFLGVRPMQCALSQLTSSLAPVVQLLIS